MQLFNGDCLDEMKRIQDGSVDMILTDLPYGCLNSGNKNAKWDCQIPMEPLWEQLLRVCKTNAAIVLFAQGMFTAKLMFSKPDLWRYNLIWDKGRGSGFLNASRMPLRCHEDICVFYRELPTYNPQKTRAKPGEETHSRGRPDKAVTNRCYGNWRITDDGDLSIKYPMSILKFKRPHCKGNHPTEKSVDLCRWLIRSYTNEGETVLDATMGSGTTGVACVLENRGFIGIEKELKYFNKAKERIAEAEQVPIQTEMNL